MGESCIRIVCFSNVAQDLSDAILNLIANAGVLMSKVRPAPPSVVGAKVPPIGVGVVGLPALSNPPPNPINPVSVT